MILFQLSYIYIYRHILAFLVIVMKRKNSLLFIKSKRKFRYVLILLIKYTR